MPPGPKTRSTQTQDEPPSKKRRIVNSETPPKSVDHIVELLPHSELKTLVLDLLKDPATSASVINHLIDRERTAAQATYDSLIAEFEEFDTEIRREMHEEGTWEVSDMEAPEFTEEIDILRKVGPYGLELAWQALLLIADNYKHNGEQGYENKDGRIKVKDDDFHWDVDNLMLECCTELVAEAPEQLEITSRLRDLNKLKNKITGLHSDLTYRYFFTESYLEWIQGEKVGEYKKPGDYDIKWDPKKT